MFNGIVETVGLVTQTETKNGCKHFTIKPQMTFDDLIIGDSVAVNGVCLTIIKLSPDSFDVTAVPETLRLTNLDTIELHSEVNLERAMQPHGRMGGHYVQGHVDGKGRILDIQKDNSDALLVKISIPRQFAKYIVTKGYIALDGMSITIIDTYDESFTVTFIPHTQQATIVKHYQIGNWINIEVDMMGKYIEKLLGERLHASTN